MPLSVCRLIMLNYLAVLWKTREREHLFVVVLLSVAHTHERRIKSRRDGKMIRFQL